MIQTDAALQVTESGQVVKEFGDRTVWDLNMERAKELAPQREAFWRDHSRDECLAEVRRLAGIRPIAEKPVARSVGVVKREGYTIEKIRIEREGEPPVPALVFLPGVRQGKLPAVLYVDGRGKQRGAGAGGPIEALVREGRAVLAIDVRGTGETAPKQSGEKSAFLGIHLGRPLPGQRTEDVLAALQVLLGREEIDPGHVRLIGIERGGPVALHAAALDEHVTELVIEEAIESWRCGGTAPRPAAA